MTAAKEESENTTVTVTTVSNTYFSMFFIPLHTIFPPHHLFHLRAIPSLRPKFTAITIHQPKTYSLFRMAPTSRREQPAWTPPSPHGAPLPPLRIYNSLTKEKSLFVPIDPSGREITWYCCGPTVYDAGHLGHARNYVTTDILRRILRDYFEFEVKFVQNVTDVDDKVGFFFPFGSPEQGYMEWLSGSLILL